MRVIFCLVLIYSFAMLCIVDALPQFCIYGALFVMSGALLAWGHEIPIDQDDEL